jgi:small neutral amino acid transporter SnatA (MarC family)
MTPQISQLAAGAAGLICTMALVFAGKIDGPTAMQAISTITGVFLGAQALTHGSTAISEAMKFGKKQ